ncbi:hypothetical protein LguiB_026008 [Lonicera macranthoides]
MSSNLPNIPEDIIILVLSKLPVKSLLQFMSVSKQWRSIISNPHFLKRDTVFLLARQHNCNFSPLIYTINNESSLKPLERPWPKVRRKYNRYDYAYDLNFVSNSCNGLVLIGSNESLFLFNPLTHYYQKVLTLDQLRNINYCVTPGFCYDMSTNEYKAVLGFSHITLRHGNKFVVVASLKRKIWEEVSFSPFDVRRAKDGPLVNGWIHWTVCNTTDDDRICAHKKIVRFDAGKNIFEELPSPKLKSGNENVILGLGVLNGCLCMACRDGKDVEVLTMKKYGAVESWTTMFIVTNSSMAPYYRDFTPLLLKKNGDVIVRMDYQELLVYNNSGDLINDVEFPTKNFGIFTASLEESLVSPGEYHWSRKLHQRLGRDIKWQRSE